MSTEQEQYKATRNSYTAAKRKVQYPEAFAGEKAAMCKSWWDSFGSFVEDMGMREEGQILCRVDNTKPYGKDNCKWLTLSQCRRAQGMVAGTVKPDGLPVGMALQGDLVCAETTVMDSADVIVSEQSPSLADVDLAEAETRVLAAQVVEVVDTTPDMLKEKQLEQANEVGAEQPPLDDELDDLLDDFDPWKEDGDD